jgi:uncharacterized membrane protein
MKYVIGFQISQFIFAWVIYQIIVGFARLLDLLLFEDL